MNDMPKGMERRLVLRLLSYWRDLLDDERDMRIFPSFADLDATAIHDIWQDCFTLDLFGHESGPVFRAVGTEFLNYSDRALSNLPVSELVPDTLAGLSTKYYAEAINKNAPISRGGQIDAKIGHVRVAERHEVAVDHPVPVLDEIGDHVSTRFATATGEEDSHGRRF